MMLIMSLTEKTPNKKTNVKSERLNFGGGGGSAKNFCLIICGFVFEV